MDALPPDHRYVAIIAQFAWPAENAAWQPLPELPPPSGTCYHCEGTCRIRNCEECDGEGVVTWSTNRHDYDAGCLECNGAGEASAKADQDGTLCPKCNGTGNRWYPRAIGVGAGHYQIALLTLIAALAHAEVAVDPNEKEGQGYHLWFRCPLPEACSARGRAVGILWHNGGARND